MSFDFAASILHGEGKAPLQTLILYNVIEPCTNHTDRPHGGPWEVESSHISTRPGCMRRLLTPQLQERCRGLDRLLLRKQGHQRERMRTIQVHILGRCGPDG